MNFDWDQNYYPKMMDRAYSAALSAIESGEQLSLYTDDDTSCSGDRSEIWGVKVGL